MALNHVLSSLTINFARLTLVRVFSFLNLAPASASARRNSTTTTATTTSTSKDKATAEGEEEKMTEKGLPQSLSTVPLIGGGGSSSSGMNSPVG